MHIDPYGYDAIGLANIVKKGEIRAIELLESTIERIEKLNPKLNAIIYKAYDLATKQAERCDSKAHSPEVAHVPFFGVPFLVKDLIAEVKGMPLNEGSRFVQGYVSKIDSDLVAKQKKAGLILVGKTNMSEFGLLPTTEPDICGATMNPWNPALTPGGSSGGSAAAVAAGIVPMAHANDGGGSIRIPASCCGLFGLKPTRGRNPLGPILGDVGSGMACEHAVTRTVRDSAALLDSTAGAQTGDPYWASPISRSFLEETVTPPGCLNIGLLNSIPEGWAPGIQIHPDCMAAVKDAGEICESLGHNVEEINPAQIAWPNLFKGFGKVFACMAAHFCIYWEKELGKTVTQDQVEPMTWLSRQAGLKCSGGEYLAVIQDLQRFTRMLANFRQSKNLDLILTPTMTIPPTELGAFTPTEQDPARGLKTSGAFIALTKIQNITGDPAMSVPLYWNDGGIPIGVQFAGNFGGEGTLLRLAAQLEEARPWVTKKAQIAA